MSGRLFASFAIALLCCTEALNTTAPACTGSADPPATAPYCFSGGQLGETVLLKVTSYTSPAGKVDISGSGLQAIDCKGKDFKKDGQTLTGDWSDCVKSPIVLKTIEYCSDQNQVLVNCQVGVVPASVPLAHGPCPSEDEPIVV
mmetsp:Transcript_64345/g.119612  ORF Transcript_64345/g.119612 Transcript_64345/m.119612 type:complete len:144 (+) Transcript_64345:66-497(+)